MGVVGRFAGKRAVVTGGASGIGRATALPIAADAAGGLDIVFNNAGAGGSRDPIGQISPEDPGGGGFSRESRARAGGRSDDRSADVDLCLRVDGDRVPGVVFFTRFPFGRTEHEERLARLATRA